jgi:DNA-binding CsgD family transcriptional regulator
MNLPFEAFEKASIGELAEGVMEDPETKAKVCLKCGKTFAAGEVFQLEDRYWEANHAARIHSEREHEPQFNYLLNLMKQWRGVSDPQAKLLEAFFRGDDDGRIASDLGISRSTVRNHRFRMKERARHAKVFTAMMQILDQKEKPEARLVDFPANTRIADERFDLTSEECERIIGKYFREDGTMTRFPIKAKERVALLRRIVGLLEPGEKYTEKALNGILSAVTDDYVLVRRCLVDYGFVSRLRDGSAYWVEL